MDPDPERIWRVLRSDAEEDMEGAWIQMQKRIWRVLGSRHRRGYGGCLDPDAEEDAGCLDPARLP